MRPLVYEQTRFSPKVIFDADRGVFEMEGTLMLEDNKVFFQTINRWWRIYQQNPNPQTQVVCKLNYYTFAADTFLMEWLFVLKDVPNVEVIWYYNPDDWEMQEFATTYQSNYSFVKLKEEKVK
ncbi:MAG TPA: hypothetical protein DCS93_25725 [Microscillaceae bacterium]|nr:hypothetical protein [Microscillaceae bacterium]